MNDYTQTFNTISKFHENYLDQVDWQNLNPTAKNDINKFFELGIPNRKNEEWANSRTSSFFAQEYNYNEIDKKDQTELFKNLKRKGFLNIIIIDGQIHLDEEFKKESIEVLSLTQAINESKDNLELILDSSSEQSDPTSFNYLNRAFLNQGVFVRLQKNQTVSMPINLHFYNTIDNSIQFFRNVLTLEESSELKIVEHYSGNAQNSYTNSYSVFKASDNAKLHHINLQSIDQTSNIMWSSKNYLEKDSLIESYLFNLGANNSKSRIHSKLFKSNATFNNYGLSALSGERNSDLYTLIEHFDSYTYADQIIKNAVDDKSRGVFYGEIQIHKDLKQIVSNQLNKNLLLSKKAQAHSRPTLKIWSDDVRCAHGSTTGQLNQDELFYFQARAIPQDKARQMLAHAFFDELILKLEDESIKNYVKSTLDQFVDFKKLDQEV